MFLHENTFFGQTIKHGCGKFIFRAGGTRLAGRRAGAIQCERSEI
jgi:hypothetical protein